MEKLGDRLRIAREKSDLTQSQVAALLNIAKRTVQNHELGEHHPPDKTIKAYARAYGCSYTWLMTGQGEAIKPFGEILDELEDTPTAHRDVLIRMRSKSADLVREQAGLYGKTKRLNVEGVGHTLTLFEPPGNQSSSRPIGQAVEMLDNVLTSGDQVLIQSLMANLFALSRAVDREKQDRGRINELEEKSESLEKKVEGLERTVKSLEEKMSGHSSRQQEPESKASTET